MDYRCHVPGGAIGFNYPPAFRACVDKWAGMSAGELEDEYGISATPDNVAAAQGTSMAERLRARAPPLPLPSLSAGAPGGGWQRPAMGALPAGLPGCLCQPERLLPAHGPHTRAADRVSVRTCV